MAVFKSWSDTSSIWLIGWLAPFIRVVISSSLAWVTVDCAWHFLCYDGNVCIPFTFYSEQAVEHRSPGMVFWSVVPGAAWFSDYLQCYFGWLGVSGADVIGPCRCCSRWQKGFLRLGSWGLGVEGRSLPWGSPDQAGVWVPLAGVAQLRCVSGWRMGVSDTVWKESTFPGSLLVVVSSPYPLDELPHCLPFLGWEERACKLPSSCVIFLVLGSQTNLPSSSHLSEFLLDCLHIISRIYSSTLWGGAGRNESTHVAPTSGGHLPWQVGRRKEFGTNLESLFSC